MGLLRSWRFSTVCKTVGYAFIGPNPIKPTKRQIMTDHHWIILVLQGFLGMTEERAICYQLVRLRHCAKKAAALKQWSCLKLEVKRRQSAGVFRNLR